MRKESHDVCISTLPNQVFGSQYCIPAEINNQAKLLHLKLGQQVVPLRNSRLDIFDLISESSRLNNEKSGL